MQARHLHRASLRLQHKQLLLQRRRLRHCSSSPLRGGHCCLRAPTPQRQHRPVQQGFL
jgi:hypothetical protein